MTHCVFVISCLLTRSKVTSTRRRMRSHRHAVESKRVEGGEVSASRRCLQCNWPARVRDVLTRVSRWRGDFVYWTKRASPLYSSYALCATKCPDEARQRGDQLALLNWNKVWLYGSGRKVDVISVFSKHVSVDRWTIAAFSTGRVAREWQEEFEWSRLRAGCL